MKNKKTRKSDNSIFVSQRDKITESFEITPFKWTEKQQTLINAALDKKNQVIFIKSPPGTGKTLLSVFCSLVLLKNKSISELLFLRCPLESSKSIGFLPAEKEAKLDVYATPLYDHLKELINKPTQDKLLKDERIRIDSIGFIKGNTFNTTAVICDESEDLSLEEIRLVMGRLGKYSKLFIIGDERQSNIKNSGFTKVFNTFNNQESIEQGILTFEFTTDDIMRNGILKFILGKLDKLS